MVKDVGEEDEAQTLLQVLDLSLSETLQAFVEIGLA